MQVIIAFASLLMFVVGYNAVRIYWQELVDQKDEATNNYNRNNPLR